MYTLITLENDVDTAPQAVRIKIIQKIRNRKPQRHIQQLQLFNSVTLLSWLIVYGRLNMASSCCLVLS